jgi:hypothetical protein
MESDKTIYDPVSAKFSRPTLPIVVSEKAFIEATYNSVSYLYTQNFTGSFEVFVSGPKYSFTQAMRYLFPSSQSASYTLSDDKGPTSEKHKEYIVY